MDTESIVDNKKTEGDISINNEGIPFTSVVNVFTQTYPHTHEGKRYLSSHELNTTVKLCQKYGTCFLLESVLLFFILESVLLFFRKQLVS